MGPWRHRSGLWGVDWHPDRATKRIRRLVGTKQEAEAVLASFVVEHRAARYPILQAPTVTPTQPLTFAELAARFLAEHPGSRRSNHYPRVLARLLPHLGPLPIRSVDRATIDRLKRANPRRGPTGPPRARAVESICGGSRRGSGCFVV